MNPKRYKAREKSNLRFLASVYKSVLVKTQDCTRSYNCLSSMGQLTNWSLLRLIN